MTIWIAAFLIFSALDIHSTYLCLSTPGVESEEMNPWLAWLIKKFGVIYGLVFLGSLAKVAGLIISVVLLLWLFKKADEINERWGRIVGYSIICLGLTLYLFVLVVVVVNNYGILFHRSLL